MIRQRVIAAVATYAVGVPVLHYGRGLTWGAAFIVGLALGAFAFLLVRAIHNLRAWRPRKASPEASAAQAAPGEEDQR